MVWSIPRLDGEEKVYVMTTGFSTISGISASQATAATNQASEIDSRSQLMDNYDTFLQLLTTQIQNQNPTEPLDAKDFTDQLVQYSGIEQQILMNDSLEALLQVQQTANTEALVSYIGKEVTANGNVSVLENGAATWTLDAEQGADNVEVGIYNEFGGLIATEQISLRSGSNQFVWDGKTSSGLDSADGAYTLEVYATDSDGNPISVESNVAGRVTQVDFTGSEPALLVGDNNKIPLSSVLTVAE